MSLSIEGTLFFITGFRNLSDGILSITIRNGDQDQVGYFAIPRSCGHLFAHQTGVLCYALKAYF